MESSEILDKARADAPGDWMVFGIVRRTVLAGIAGWIFGAIFAGIFFVFLVPILIPHNYQIGIFPAILSTLLMGVILFVCLGSIWALIVDINRLRKPEEHLIVLTPDDFVKQEGKKIVHVPLEYVKYVTARGRKPVESNPEGSEVTRGGTMENIGSLFVGRQVAGSAKRGIVGKQMRTPDSLAFLDDRTQKEVIVVSDKSYGDPHLIGAYLKEFVTAKNSNTVS